MKKSGFIFGIIFFLLMLSFNAGYTRFKMDILKVHPFSSVEKIPAGGSFKIALQVGINSQYHINSNEPLDESAIPTEIKFNPVDGVSFGKLIYPEGELKKFSFSEDELLIFEGTITIFAEVTLRDTFPPGPLLLSGVFSYQACTDQNCFMPQQDKFQLTVQVVDASQPAVPINQEIFKAIPVEKEIIVSTEAGQVLTSDEAKAKEIIEKGLFYAIAAFFVFGLALNLTPCVYPVIPITVSYFGGQTDKKRGHALLRASFYVIGIAIIFALLGLISGLAGKQWGFLFQNPWFVIIVTVIILAMAASMFGAFEIRIPASFMNKFGQAREGIIGSLIMGLTVGVVIAPCAAGIIIGLVGLVAKLGIVVKGTMLFFVMGLGLGLPYLILATFSGLLTKLPQSGMWMIWIKKFFGVLLVGVALYFFLPQARHIADMQGFFFGLLAIFGGLLLGFLDHAPGYTKAFKIGRGIFGALLILIGILWVDSAIHYEAPEIDWHQYSGESVAELVTDEKPVFIDFYADWCAPCKELEKKTFPDPQIVEIAKNFTMVKVDCTAPNAKIRAFMNKFHVTGMPTLVFIDAKGNEITNLREIGFMKPAELLKRMQATLSGGK